ncbi:exodeoxyribonuclease V subunit gamma [Pokkaliibacter plantistimulans]|uniref:RecBCD enzyme subunit RecC n=1 Tax=Pokkaliibacter plantistimulans TaxID=1635171 RepID=A0ABX5M1Q2_9GAMM|nr:exodeoxyribonuclease V subunit gamma [Pokkaliibacter plantistimulans]PXF32812.1 exodeoxyribonuclease V subunit gamma [Pokkaliibacter plantistimulans]
MSETPLSPGLMVIHGNHPEALRDVLVAWMQRYPLAPLENEVVLVQSNGIAQWLKLALAEHPDNGGCGIAAAIDAQLPSRFLWQAYRAVLGEERVPKTSPFDKAFLIWRLMRLLPALLRESVFSPLERFLSGDHDLRKRHQLAVRLADLFDQYQVYRADWLADWARGADVLLTSRDGHKPVPDNALWQPRLWRALLDDVGAEQHTSRAEIHRRFLAAVPAMASQQRPQGLPRRLLVFGISSLPQQALEVLAAIANWTQVLMCVHNPCEHFWADIIADKDLLRAERRRQSRKSGMPEMIPDDQLHLHAHPLLAAWGKQGRDFIGLLDVHDEREHYEQRFLDIQQRVDLFNGNGDDTLLQQLQEDIRDLRPVAESRALWPAVDTARDHSLRFHVVHSAQREVEVLHDQILAARAANPRLQPRDIIVMVPDINNYAHHIQAVFGQFGWDDPRYIPYSLADRGQRSFDPLLNAVEKLLGLPLSRFAVSDLLDLLEVPALRRRFAIDEQQLPLLHRWIAAARIRWGLHAEQRQSLALPQAPEQNTWLFGLRRMLLGYAVGSGEAWGDIEPMDEIGGLDAALLGPLSQLLDRLDQHWQLLCSEASVQQWVGRVRALMDDFFAADEAEDGYTLLQLENVLQAWQEEADSAAMNDDLPLAVVREHLLGQLDQSSLSQPFFAGAVTFATLMPMRAIPFRHVYLLGMNDGDYPRTRIPMDFDLMGHDYRPGDRSRREDDRYLFLEAMLSAREHLHISWIGRSINDNSERPPSVLVAQLRDHLAAVWRLQGQEQDDAALLHALTVEHRLQPFNRDYFSAQGPLFSYANEWREGLLAEQQGQTPVSSTATLAAFPWEEALSLKQLADFLRDPLRYFLRVRLGVHFELDDPASEDQEPFALDGLGNWQIQDELIQAQLLAVQQGGDRLQALDNQLQRVVRRGDLAPGNFAVLQQEQLIEPMDTLFEQYEQVLAQWPNEQPDEPLECDIGEQPVSDWLTHMRSNAAGQRGRVVLTSSGMIKNRAYRHDKLLPYWLAHVAGHLGGQPLTTVVISKNGTVHLPPLASRQQATDYWEVLMASWKQALTRPLALDIPTALAWQLKGGRPDCDDDTRAAASDAAATAFAQQQERNPYLNRVWQNVEQLLDSDDFARLSQQLLQPLIDALGKPAKGDK